jgi:hypothetical protein
MMSPIVSNIIILKNGNGGVYWPAFGVNLIGNMLSGEGYQINLSVAASLTYPANSVSAKTEFTTVETVYFEKVIPSDNNMTLGIPLSAFDNLPNIGTEVGVFDKAGQLVGCGVYTGTNMAISIWGDDNLTAKNEGLSCAHAFDLKIWNGYEEQKIAIESWIEGDGLYKTNDIQIAGKVTVSSLENTSFVLDQNAPNPFRNKTYINFYLPKTSEISLTIFDVLGNVVEVLTQGSFQAGNHSIEWDDSKYANGNYFYRLIASDFVDTKQMEISR